MITDKFQRWSRLIGVLFLAGTAFSQSAQPAKKQPAMPAKTAQPQPKITIEPKAVEVLKATSDKLAAAHALSFTAIELFENLSRQGAPLGYTTKYEVTLQRPDKLRVLMPADGPASDFYYDGKSMMAYAPAGNLLAIAEAPATIDATLEKANHLAAIYFPFDDLIVANPYGDMELGLKHAYYVGQSQVVGRTTTDIVAYVDSGVFIQMWVGAEDKLPRLVRAIFLDDPERLRYELAFSDWKLDETVPADTFTPSIIATARRIAFANPNAEPAPGVKPLAKRKSTKTQQGNETKK